MNSAIREIHEALDRGGMKHEVRELSGQTFLVTGMTGKAGQYRIVFVKEGDSGNDVAMRFIRICKCAQGKEDEAREILNGLQLKYRLLRFTIGEGGYVSGEYDFPTNYKDIGNGALETCLQMVLIMEACRQEFQRIESL